MKIFVEKSVTDSCSRGPRKFVNKLVKEMRRQGAHVTFSRDPSCTVSLTLPSWKDYGKIMPRIMRMDGIFPGTAQEKIDAIRTRILRSDHVVWQSNFAKDEASKIFGVPPVGSVIHNGDDPEVYKVQRLDRCGKKWVILVANWIDNKGRYRGEKRLDQIVEVADIYRGSHPDVMFMVAGDTGRPDLARPNVKMLGKLDHPNLVRYLVSANCMLFMGVFDICPNAVVEALVPGTPVICCNGNGAEELVGMGFGEVLRVDEPINLQFYNSPLFRAPTFSNEKVIAALDRWSGCEQKKPAEKLFISQTAKKYIEVFERFERKG